jgi:hypothetical protein
MGAGFWSRLEITGLFVSISHLYPFRYGSLDRFEHSLLDHVIF